MVYKMNKKIRKAHHVITWWPETLDEYMDHLNLWSEFGIPNAKFLACQAELCPDTQRLHAHIYVEMERSMRWPEVFNRLRIPENSRPDYRKGTRTQAREYTQSGRWCKKHSRDCACELSYDKGQIPETSYTWGTFRAEGKPKSARTGMADKALWLIVNDGWKPLDFAAKEPNLYFKFHAAINAVCRARTEANTLGMLTEEE